MLENYCEVCFLGSLGFDEIASVYKDIETIKNIPFKGKHRRTINILAGHLKTRDGTVYISEDRDSSEDQINGKTDYISINREFKVKEGKLVQRLYDEENELDSSLNIKEENFDSIK